MSFYRRATSFLSENKTFTLETEHRIIYSSTIEHQHSNKIQKRKHLVLGYIKEICVRLYKTIIEVKFTERKQMNNK